MFIKPAPPNAGSCCRTFLEKRTGRQPAPTGPCTVVSVQGHPDPHISCKHKWGHAPPRRNRGTGESKATSPGKRVLREAPHRTGPSDPGLRGEEPLAWPRNGSKSQGNEAGSGEFLT